MFLCHMLMIKPECSFLTADWVRFLSHTFVLQQLNECFTSAGVTERHSHPRNATEHIPLWNQPVFFGPSKQCSPTGLPEQGRSGCIVGSAPQESGSVGDNRPSVPQNLIPLVPRGAWIWGLLGAWAHRQPSLLWEQPCWEGTARWGWVWFRWKDEQTLWCHQSPTGELTGFRCDGTHGGLLMGSKVRGAWKNQHCFH